jgi:pimeloyl-ACP methyl ester carboxylesterase
MKRIYILHGWAYSTEKWEPFVKGMETLGFKVEMLKIPGLTAAIDRVWDLNDYVDWLGKILEKEKDVILLGHSNGGRISLAYVAKYPKKVSHLFLLDSAGIYHNELPIRIKRFVFGRAAKFGKLVTKSKSMKALLYKFSREHDYEKAERIVRETMLNLIRADLQHAFGNVKTPTTIIWGAGDKVTPPGDGEVMHKGIKGSTLHVVKGARHSPMFTHVGEVVEIIKKYGDI